MILTIHIDGRWTARGLATFLDALEAFAGFTDDGSVVRLGLQPPNVKDNGDGTISITQGMPRSYLSIVRLAFNSPGTIDLLGVAKIIEQVRLFLEFLINLYVLRNDRELELEERKVELARKRAEVLARIAEVHPQFVPFVEKEAADALIQAVFEGRITAVTTKGSDTE
jgi:hypothetical protein